MRVFGAVNLTDQQSPPAAPAGGVWLYARSRAGRRMLSVEDPTGLDQPVQGHLGYGGRSVCLPNAGANSVSSLGTTTSTVGTLTARTPSFATTLAASTRRTGLVSAATAGSTALIRGSATQVARGAATGVGGFLAVLRWVPGPGMQTAGCATFVGLAGVAAIGNVDPSTVTNLLGVGKDAADANLQLMTNDGSGVATKVDLGAAFPGATQTADVYQLTLAAAPFAAAVGWTLERLNTGDVAEGTITTDMPAGATGLAPQLWAGNRANAVAISLDFAGFVTESPT